MLPRLAQPDLETGIAFDWTTKIHIDFSALDFILYT